MNEPSPLSFRAPALNPATESDAIIMMIERAARDPSIDLDKLQRLIEMRNAIRTQEREIAFDDAMAAAQQEISTIAPDSTNPQTRSKYASLAAVDKVLRPIYSKHGFSLSFNNPSQGTAENTMRISCRVAKSGCGRDFQTDMPCDGKGAKGGEVMTRTHAAGSAISYGRRYLLLMIFNATIGEMDDDGNGAGKIPDKVPEFITTEQQAQLQQHVEDIGGDVEKDTEKLCRYLKVSSLAQLPLGRFSEAVTAIARAAAARKKDTV